MKQKFRGATTWLKGLLRDAGRAALPLLPVAAMVALILWPALALAAIGDALSALPSAWELAGYWGVGALVVRTALRYGRPWLQKQLASAWPSQPWAGYALTVLASGLVAACTEVLTGAGISWAIAQVAVQSMLSLLGTLGLDAKTAEMQIFAKGGGQLGTPITTVSQGGTLDGPSQPAGPVDPPADAGPT